MNLNFFADLRAYIQDADARVYRFFADKRWMTFGAMGARVTGEAVVTILAAVQTNALLLEDGSHLELEDGNTLGLES
jgi:hypothetical protein